jgi:hypothetical protein
VHNVVLFPKIRKRSATQAKWDEFIATLESLADLTRGRYLLEPNRTNEVAIARNDHVLGVWRIVDGCYLYTPTSHSQPTFRSPDLTLAMRQVQKLLAPSEHVSQIELRRYERWPVHWSAVLRSPTVGQTVLVEDVSPGGLRMRAKGALRLGDALVVELPSRDELTGNIAWLRGSQCGVAYRCPLSPDDPLLIAAQGASSEHASE